MNNFQHFLVTRINVDWAISKIRSKEERNSIDFLGYRLDLFEKICYPSVNAQINKNFIWLILFDSNLPNEFRRRIANYHSEIRIIPVYIESKETFLSTLKKKIAENILEQTTHIITTNLDSDDVISEDFIDSTQRQFRGQDFEFINFPFGYLYQLKKQKLFLREWLTSPFYSLIERYENFETVSKYSHAHIPSDKTSQIITNPMWLMTAHAQNDRTRFDVAAAWQPFYRIGSKFCTEINFPQKDFLTIVREFFREIVQILFSKRKWDTPKAKSRKILNILFPSLIRFTRKLRYR